MAFNKGYLMVMGAGICWGATGIFGTMLIRSGMDPILIATCRVFSTVLLLFPYIFLTKYRSRIRVGIKDFLGFAVYGLISVAVFNFLYLQSISLLGASMAVVLLYTSPAFVIILSLYFLKEALTQIKIISLIMTVLGVFLAVTGFDFSMTRLSYSGVVMGLGAGLSFALLSIFSRYALRKHEHLTLIFYILLFGSIFLSVVRPPWLIFNYELNIYSYLYLSALVFVSTFMAYLLYIYGLKYLEAGKASILVAVEPLTAIFLATLFLNERLLLPQYAGVVLVIWAILLLSFSKG